MLDIQVLFELSLARCRQFKGKAHRVSCFRSSLWKHERAKADVSLTTPEL